MKQRNEISQKIVENYARTKGVEIQIVPREVGKTPDFRFMLNGEVAVVEVKEKQDDPKKLQEIKEKLQQKSEVATSKPIMYANTIAGRLDKAAKQLDASKVLNGIRIAWINFTGHSPEVDSRLLFKTLFGGQDLITEHPERMSYCYFYNESTFFKHRDSIDVVIGSYVKDNRIRLRLYLNPLSTRQSLALDSIILRSLGFIPKREIDETNPQVMVLDENIPRKDVAHKSMYLKKKYGLLQLEEFNSSVISVTMQFDFSDFLPPEE